MYEQTRIKADTIMVPDKTYLALYVSVMKWQFLSLEAVDNKTFTKSYQIKIINISELYDSGVEDRMLLSYNC